MREGVVKRAENPKVGVQAGSGWWVKALQGGSEAAVQRCSSLLAWANPQAPRLGPNGTRLDGIKILGHF